MKKKNIEADVFLKDDAKTLTVQISEDRHSWEGPSYHFIVNISKDGKWTAYRYLSGDNDRWYDQNMREMCGMSGREKDFIGYIKTNLKTLRKIAIDKYHMSI